MDYDFAGWIGMALRWLHVVAGVAWIGASFYFVWLDNNLRDPNPPKDGVKGELWAVHGGGFYHSQKYLNAPAHMPEHLHWFKWEAYTTWLSGFALLIVLYYVGAPVYLIDPAKHAFSQPQAIGVGLAFIDLDESHLDHLVGRGVVLVDLGRLGIGRCRQSKRACRDAAADQFGKRLHDVLQCVMLLEGLHAMMLRLSPHPNARWRARSMPALLPPAGKCASAPDQSSGLPETT